jgi:hypothetical protein
MEEERRMSNREMAVVCALIALFFLVWALVLYRLVYGVWWYGG